MIVAAVDDDDDDGRRKDNGIIINSSNGDGGCSILWRWGVVMAMAIAEQWYVFDVCVFVSLSSLFVSPPLKYLLLLIDGCCWADCLH